MKSNRGLKVKDAMESKEMVLEALGNVEGTPREIVALNAGAALYAANLAASIEEGIVTRARSDRQRRGARKLDAFVATTQKLAIRERHEQRMPDILAQSSRQGGRGHRRASRAAVRRRRCRAPRGDAAAARLRAARSARRSRPASRR